MIFKEGKLQKKTKKIVSQPYKKVGVKVAADWGKEK